MICAEDNSEKAILSALREGKFYASMGPEFKRLSYDKENKIFEAEFSEVESAVLLTNKSRGFRETVPGDPFPSSHILATKMRVDVSSLPAGSYIRCQIRDAQGHYAWSNPILI